MANFGAVTSLAYTLYESGMKFLLYTTPFFLVAVILILIYFYLRRRNLYGLDCIIYTVADNNLIQGRDRGGIIKNALGVEEFRFKKRKKGCPVPNRKHWVMQDNGKFCIHFYRHSEDDFEPCEAKPDYADTKVPILNKKVGIKDKIKGFIQPGLQDVPQDEGLHDFNIKKQFQGINFTPIKSDSKQYLNMKAKEIVAKNKKKKASDKWVPVIMYGSLIIGFILLLLWGFDYGKSVMDHQVNTISPEVCKEVAEQVYGVAKEVETAEPPAKEGFKTPFG